MTAIVTRALLDPLEVDGHVVTYRELDTWGHWCTADARDHLATHAILVDGESGGDFCCEVPAHVVEATGRCLLSRGLAV